jgi:hypothetical protein
MPPDAEIEKKRGSSEWARLKDAIDSGRTRDKVPGFDPAIAPLGTDDESAGVSPPDIPDDISAKRTSRAAELAANPAGIPRSVYRWQDRIIWPAILVGTAVIVLAILAAVLLIRRLRA